MRNFIFITLTALILCKTDCLLAQSKFPAAEECENKTNKEGKRAGKWLIPYIEYNWEKSKLKVAIDVNNLDEIKLNTNGANYDPNQLDPNQICFLENVSYKNGLKHGKAYFYKYEKENKKAVPLASAKYDAGKLDGEVLFFKDFNDINPYAKILYSNNKIVDQIINWSVFSLESHNQSNIRPLIRIKEYEIVSNGISVEHLNWISDPDFSESKLQALNLAFKICNSPRFEYPSAIIMEKMVTNSTKKFTCIPIGRRSAGSELITGVTQLEQLVSIDTSGNLKEYSELLVYRSNLESNYLLDNNRFFFGLKPENSCLVLKMSINPSSGLPNGDFTEFYFNENLDERVANNEKKILAKGKYLNGLRNESYNLFYPDNKLAATMTFNNGALEGRFISHYNPNFQVIFVPNFPRENKEFSWQKGQRIYDLDSKKGSREFKHPDYVYHVECPYVNVVEPKEIFSQLGRISQCNHVSPKNYKEISYVCDFSKNKVSSDIVYFYNEKNIIFRQGVDLNLSTDRDWTYYNIGGNVCLTESQALADFKAKSEKEQVLRKQEIEKYLNTTVKCYSCTNNLLIKNSIVNANACDCVDINGTKNTEFENIWSVHDLYFCSLQCKILWEKDCCKRHDKYYPSKN